MTNYAKGALLCVVLGLAVAGTMWIWGEPDSKEAVGTDLRGIYAHPGIGAYFVGVWPDSLPLRTPLTLVILFSAESECYDCLTEVDVYRRLDSVFSERGQRVVAFTMREDSVAIDSFLCVNRLNIPLVVSRLGLTFERLGISPLFMPFKILYDSNLTAIYMRGANNTPESQAHFERAMLRLSEFVDEKRKDSL